MGENKNPSIVTTTKTPKAFLSSGHLIEKGYIILGDDTINSTSELPEGQAVGKITASGKIGQYDDTAVDGREVCIGYLMEAVLASTAAGDSPVMVLRHGAVITTQLTDYDAAAAVDTPAILYE